jgi:hypothetical protein
MLTTTVRARIEDALVLIDLLHPIADKQHTQSAKVLAMDCN